MFYFFLGFTFFTLTFFFSRNFSRLLGFLLFLFTFFFTLSLAFFFHQALIPFQFLEVFSHLDFWNFAYILGVDGLSLSLLILSSFLVIFCCLNY